MKKNEEENWTSVSTGYATFSAEDISHYDKSDNTTPDNMLLSGDVRYYGNPMNWESTKGDLISREALKEQFNHLEMVTNNSSVVEQSEYKMLMTCIGLIENAPTVYPKQGEWKLDSLGAYCSECGTHPDYSSNYCPNCGASMEGGAEG